MKKREKLTSISLLLYNYYLFIRDFFKEFFHDKLGFYAASMSWSTLFFLIPFLVILLVIFTHMPIFDTTYNQLHQMLEKSLAPTNSKAIMQNIDMFVANANRLGVIGSIYVLFAAVMFFRDYDFIVNDIFETSQRGLFSAFKTYSILMILVPVMLGVSFWLSNVIQKYLEDLGLATLFHIYFILPYLIIWGLFYIAYQISPAIPIDSKASIISSFIASVIWYLGKSLFLYYIYLNKSLIGIYGSVSSILFFFLWIYISWAIFLHGLRFCYILNRYEDDE